MPFQIKDFASIVAAQINHARSVTAKITDYQPGSVARTLMEAPAVEIEELYLQMFLGLRDAIPVATFLSFGFDPLPAARAVGYISVSSATPLAEAFVIPDGTEFLAPDGRRYTAVAEVVWAAGSSVVQVLVQHTVAGLVGNIAAGAITSSALFGAAYTVSNQTIETGRDVETDAEREARFAEFIQSISRGTLVACTYMARQSRVLDDIGNIAEYVTRIGVDEQAGRVRIYLYSSLGAPSAALLADGQTRIDGSVDEVTGAVTSGYRAAGVRFDVLGMLERAVPLSILVDMLPGYTLNTAIEQELGDIFSASVRSVQPGDTLYLGTLIESLLAVAGIRSIVPSSTSNIVCEINEALTPGALTVAAL
jgi:uncharacterized phage protein gp47/JayE